ncbi:MAG: hypothetical protein ACJ72M_10655, partial [Propionibacteriaceae bacterium]
RQPVFHRRRHQEQLIQIARAHVHGHEKFSRENTRRNRLTRAIRATASAVQVSPHHSHFLQKGWTCRINDEGLPEWIPPRWIDADQQGHINARVRRLHAQPNLPRRRPSADAA